MEIGRGFIETVGFFQRREATKAATPLTAIAAGQKSELEIFGASDELMAAGVAYCADRMLVDEVADV
jgi:hypothetical protein